MRVGLSHPRPRLLRRSPLSTRVTTGDILSLQEEEEVTFGQLRYVTVET